MPGALEKHICFSNFFHELSNTHFFSHIQRKRCLKMNHRMKKFLNNKIQGTKKKQKKKFLQEITWMPGALEVQIFFFLI